MGNSVSGSSSSSTATSFVRREESFGSKSPSHGHTLLLNTMGSSSDEGKPFGSSDRITLGDRQRRFASNPTANRSQSLEQSRSSSSNSYVNSIINGAGPSTSDRTCLRQSAQPKFQISGDLNPHQIRVVKRTWKQVMKSVNEDSMEISSRLLQRIFVIDYHNQEYFNLQDVPYSDLRLHPVFLHHVRAIEPVLVHVMTHLTNATSLSKYLQQLGGRHVQLNGLSYRSSYWKNFVQALVDIASLENATADVYDAFMVLGAFCVEQMRIGYRIEHKLRREAEKLTLAQQQRRKQANTHTNP